MDFGAACRDQRSRRIRRFGLMGIRCTSRPEVLEGVPPSEQSDLYSLGVLLYYLASGEFPVTASSVTICARRTPRPAPVAARCPAGLPAAFRARRRRRDRGCGLRTGRRAPVPWKGAGQRPRPPPRPRHRARARLGARPAATDRARANRLPCCRSRISARKRTWISSAKDCQEIANAMASVPGISRRGVPDPRSSPRRQRRYPARGRRPQRRQPCSRAACGRRHRPARDFGASSTPTWRPAVVAAVSTRPPRRRVRRAG